MTFPNTLNRALLSALDTMRVVVASKYSANASRSLHMRAFLNPFVTALFIGAKRHVLVVVIFSTVATVAISLCSTVASVVPTVSALNTCSLLALTAALLAKLVLFVLLANL